MLKNRAVVAVAAIAVSSLLAGCSFFSDTLEPAAGQSEAVTSGWSQEMRDHFVTTCSAQTQGQDELCECALAIVEKKYFAGEILKEEEDLKNGTSQILTEIQSELILNCADKLK